MTRLFIEIPCLLIDQKGKNAAKTYTRSLDLLMALNKQRTKEKIHEMLEIRWAEAIDMMKLKL